MNNTSQYDWAVVGAGPAGIAAVGQLLDHGIAADRIAWIDPEFKVGDVGTRWRSVPSNTKVHLFLKFLNNCKSFRFAEQANQFELSRLEPGGACQLGYMAEPLQWVTDHLVESVNTVHAKLQSLALRNRAWHLQCGQTQVIAKQVVLATGSEPRGFADHANKTVELATALNTAELQQAVAKTDTVVVFGSSHSAILVLRDLVDYGVKRIINFYKQPLKYALPMGDWILFDDTGLKSATADWARQHIDGSLPDNVERYYSDTENVQRLMPECNKVIYAIGFERRNSYTIEGMPQVEYNDKNGIIAPGLFGLGIAYPERYENCLGMQEYRVGMWKFMDYLNRMMPIWLQYKC